MTEPSVNRTEIDYWHSRWNNKLIRFHIPGLNPALASLLPRWCPQGNESIFFPLCGKTLDMAILARSGFKVSGSECVLVALEECAKEANSVLVTYEPSKVNGLTQFTIPLESNNPSTPQPHPLEIYYGDHFAWPQPSPVTYDRIFDRGALVAIQPSQRRDYLKISDSILSIGGSILLACLEYDQTETQGPPWSLNQHQVEELFSELETEHYKYSIELIESFTDAGHFAPMLLANGGRITAGTELRFIITKVAK